MLNAAPFELNCGLITLAEIDDWSLEVEATRNCIHQEMENTDVEKEYREIELFLQQTQVSNLWTRNFASIPTPILIPSEESSLKQQRSLPSNGSWKKENL